MPRDTLPCSACCLSHVLGTKEKPSHVAACILPPASAGTELACATRACSCSMLDSPYDIPRCCGSRCLAHEGRLLLRLKCSCCSCCGRMAPAASSKTRQTRLRMMQLSQPRLQRCAPPTKASLAAACTTSCAQLVFALPQLSMTSASAAHRSDPPLLLMAHQRVYSPSHHH